jgi:hypothetical protein
LPHSEIPGSKPARGSPGLVAACHVLHRLLAPRHPPDALAFLDPPQRQPRHAPQRAGPGDRHGWAKATTYKKHTHAFSTHAPDGRRRACVHACQRPLAQRRTEAQRPALVPANGLSSPLHDVKDRATGRAGGAKPRRSRHEARARLARVRQAGKGFPWAFGARTGQAAGSSPPPPGSGRGAMVGLGRLERPTSRLSGVRSNQLSYRPESHPNRIAGPTPRPGPKRGGPRGRRSIGCAKGRADGGGGP